MWYLFFEIWVWLAVSFALGMLVHKFLFASSGKKKEQSVSSTSELISTAFASDSILEQNTEYKEINGSTDQPQDSWKPVTLTGTPTQVDDLKRIKGIGDVLEEKLNGLGIYQYSQIANWSEDNVSWVNEFLSFSGRIERENWIGQAQSLQDGGSTDFSQRVDSGDVDY